MKALNTMAQSEQDEAASRVPEMTLDRVTQDPASIFRSTFPENAGIELARVIRDAANGYIQGFDDRRETLKADLESTHGVVPTGKLADTYQTLQQHAQAIAERAESRLNDLGHAVQDGTAMPSYYVTPEVAAWFGTLAAFAEIDALPHDMQSEQQNELEL